jgi:site-specific DNA-methyltransferase (adenine-specific)
MIDLLCGDNREVLKTLPEKSVHCCVTSPPYYGLRSYCGEGTPEKAYEIGLEQTPEQYVANLVEVFREVKRVLRDDGTLWLNLGDSYAGGKTGRGDTGEGYLREGRTPACEPKQRAVPPGLKPKDLIGIPWMVAFALRADGWYLRNDIIWAKPNPMPESVTDRCTKAHEYIFLMSKSALYYWDGEAIKEESVEPPRAREKNNGESAVDTKMRGHDCACGNTGKRNKRTVWTVTTKPYKEAHFATFPPDLIEPCILAGAPVGGVVLDPFGGSGTTGAVAIKHGRRAVLCELNPEYAAMIPDRVAAIAGPLFARAAE